MWPQTAPFADVLLPGTSWAEKSGTFTNTSAQPLYDVTFAPRVPSGWSASAAVRALRVAPGESLNGRWTVKTGSLPVVGLTDVEAWLDEDGQRTATAFVMIGRDSSQNPVAINLVVETETGNIVSFK